MKKQDAITHQVDAVVMKIWYNFLFGFCDLVGTRFTDKQYSGHGNFSERRGWKMPFGYTVWFDNDYS